MLNALKYAFFYECFSFNMIYDLHTHSSASDGSLNPAELVLLAKSFGVDVLALTDHDGIDGLDLANKTAKQQGIQFIPGIELSVTWKEQTIHIIGLNINTDYQPLLTGIKQLQQYRDHRALEIANSLEQHGLTDVLSGVKKISSGKMLGRLHFAKYLISQGYAKDIKQVFKHFLVPNKPGFIKDQWLTLKQAVSWIVAAHGVAIIAHPLHYQLKLKKIKTLIEEFVDYGGQAIEVVSGSQSQSDTERLASLAKQYHLYASIGSDFHNLETPWNSLGKLPLLPLTCQPVWNLINI